MTKYNGWDKILNREFDKDYFKTLHKYLESEYAKYTIYPPKDKVFNAFMTTSLDDVKIVILGQDPYINEGQAEGLAFSVPNGTKIPPSLRNIFKLMKIDLGIDRDNTHLEDIARQGVLLLNTTLTVRQGHSMSHKGKGWEIFTDNIIRALNDRDKPILFVLWGGNARSKAELITNPIHEIIESVHPSPLSAYNGYFESQHFAKMQDFLVRHGYKKIDFS